MSTTYRNLGVGVEITVTKQAALLIGDQNVPEIVARLTEMMSDLGANRAFISKRGTSVEITITDRLGWTGHMRFERKAPGGP